MSIKSFSVPNQLWERALKKARKNAQSLSGVIQRLLELWVEGKIDITQNGD